MLRRALIAAVAVGLVAACDGNPTAPTRQLTLSFCGLDNWVAYQNDGGQWTLLTTEQSGTFTFQATDRLTIATARVHPGAVPSLNVYYFSARQAAMHFQCNSGGGYPTRALSGAVQGLPPDYRAEISLGPTSGGVIADSPEFMWEYAPAGTFDLVAAREPPYWIAEHVDRLIIRRAQAHADGTIPLLDFESGEAFPPAETALSWTGSGAHVQINFRTLSGNNIVLSSTVVDQGETNDVPRSATLYSVPAAKLAPGDLHQLMVSGGRREVTTYYREPRDVTAMHGPSVSQPSFTTLATSPNLRIRADIASQAEYPAHIFIYLSQREMGEGGATVNITATREHFGGTPQTWSLEIPDLNGVPGFPTVAGLQPGGFEWDLFVTNRPYVIPEPVPAEGEIRRSSNAYGSQP